MLLLLKQSCNVSCDTAMLLYNIVQCGGTWLVYAVHQTLPVLWELVYLVTKCNAGASKSTLIVLLKTYDSFNTKHLITLHLKLQYFSASVLAFVTRLFHCWLGLGMRLVDNKIKQLSDLQPSVWSHTTHESSSSHQTNVFNCAKARQARPTHC